MSLRMEISGFDYAQMASYLGSKDDGLKQVLAGEFESQLLGGEEMEEEASERKQDLDEAVRLIGLAIDKGATDSGVEVENEVCCYVVNLIAHHNQTHLLTDSSEWKMGVLWDIQDQYASMLSSRMNTFLGYFVEGRPVLGNRIQTNWSYYAYLLNQEVKELAKELSAIQKQFQGDNSFVKYQEFISEFEGWLLAILESQKDLWFWAE